MKAATMSFDNRLGGGNILLWGLGSGQRSYFDQWKNLVATTRSVDDYIDPYMVETPYDTETHVYEDQVMTDLYESNWDQYQSGLPDVQAQRIAEEEAAAAVAAAVAAAARIAEAEAVRQAEIEAAAKYKAQMEAELLARQAETARLIALQTEADLSANSAQIANAQAEAERLAAEAKASAEALAAQQRVLREANEAAAKAGLNYASTLIDNNTPKAAISDSSQIFIAGGVAVIGILALLFK